MHIAVSCPVGMGMRREEKRQAMHSSRNEWKERGRQAGKTAVADSLTINFFTFSDATRTVEFRFV